MSRSSCTCQIVYEEGLLRQRIVYCPLHAAADEMLAALIDIMEDGLTGMSVARAEKAIGHATQEVKA